MILTGSRKNSLYRTDRAIQYMNTVSLVYVSSGNNTGLTDRIVQYK